MTPDHSSDPIRPDESGVDLWRDAALMAIASAHSSLQALLHNQATSMKLRGRNGIAIYDSLLKTRDGLWAALRVLGADDARYCELGREDQ